MVEVRASFIVDEHGSVREVGTVAKQGYRCGLCGGHGHSRRTCGRERTPRLPRRWPARMPRFQG